MTKAKRERLKKRLEFWLGALDKMQEAYIELIEGKVQRYRIDDRSLTKLDLPKLLEEIREAEQIIDELEAALDGTKARKAFAVIPRDW